MADRITDVMANQDALRRYLDMQRSASANARQGTLEPLLLTGQFTTGAGGLLAANSRIQLGLDTLGVATASGLAQTEADTTHVSGKVPSGQVWLLRGMGFSIWAEPNAANAQDIQILSRVTSVEVDLRGTPVKIGNMGIWPSPLDARGIGNGNVQMGVTPLSPPVVLEPNQDISFTLTTRRAVTLSQANTNYRVSLYGPMVRIFDPVVLGRN